MGAYEDQRQYYIDRLRIYNLGINLNDLGLDDLIDIHNAIGQSGEGLAKIVRLQSVKNSAPANIGTRFKDFDSITSVYNSNSENMHNIRALISSIFTGNRVRIGMLGHSIVAGSHATQIGIDDSCLLLRKRLASTGLPIGGTGIVYCYHNELVYGPDVRFSNIDPAWLSDGGNNVSAPFWVVSSGAGKQLTFTSDVAGSVVQILTTENSAAFTYAIDGGPAVAINPSGASILKMVEISGLPDTTHTVVITSAAGSNYIFGIGVRKDSGGIEITNAGIGGSFASNWLPTANGGTFFNPLHVLQNGVVPEFYIVQLDSNEVLNNISSSVFYDNMQEILSSLNKPFIIVRSPSMVPGGNGYTSVDQSTWNRFGSVTYDLADQYDVPLLDLTERFGTWENANNNNLMGDQVHPNPHGYSFIAQGLAKLLTS